MSENTHIDKIFKDGLGDMKFSNADAMWQNMEAELDKENGNKRRPVVFFITLAVLLTAGFFGVQHFNQPTAPAMAEIKTVLPTTAINEVKQENKNILTEQNVAVVNDASNTSGNTVNNTSSVVTAKQTAAHLHNNNHVVNTIAHADFKITVASEIGDPGENIIAGENEVATNDIQLERINATAELITVPNATLTTVIKPVSKNINSTTPAAKREIAKASKITIEAVGGGDFLRMNRKVGYYAGVRVSKILDKHTLVSAGLNYTSHTVRDGYRLYDKPATIKQADVKLNSVSMIRMPIYLQKQMGNSKFALMAGLVPSYVIDAEIYNVPNSFVGNPDPYRKFTIEDMNRFNVLFGAGIRYNVVKGIALELSGSYGLTGLVKDGYKNQSRVNDNFKSIQIGAAFRLK
jgi:hypothetical protein